MHATRILILPVIILMLGSCSIMGNNNTGDNAPTPPRNLSADNNVTPVIATPPPENSHTQQPTSSAAVKSAKLAPSDRIQEKKSYGGEVEEVKVNNINKVPPYYIYPKQSGVDTNAPSSDNVATPNWKVSW